MERKDGRSARIVYVAHCLLNQNCTVPGLKSPSIFPAYFTPIIDVLLRYNTSIIQMPCPERDILGVDRAPMNKDEIPITKFQSYLTSYAETFQKEVTDYIQQDYTILAVIGKRGSPFCGVRKSWVTKGNLADTSGYLIDTLRAACKKHSREIPFYEYDTNKPGKSDEELKVLLDK